MLSKCRYYTPEPCFQTKNGEKLVRDIGFLSDSLHSFQQLEESYAKNNVKSDDEKQDKIEKELLQEDNKPQKAFPPTTASMIGWKAETAKKDHAYGIPDTRARGKNDIFRVLKWPHQGM